jgi:PEP-CTERM motif
MQPTKRDSGTSLVVGAILAGAVTVAVAAVPQPPINGVVVEDVTRPFIFDQVGVTNEVGPFTDEDAYQGTVRSMVIRAPDNTFDFLFHFTLTSGTLRSFSYAWQAPASYSVAYHVTDPELPFAPEGPSSPRPGLTGEDATEFSTSWLADEVGGGSLNEGVLMLDTDATAYAATASYVVRDFANRTQGFYDGESPTFTTFGPAIPEPESYALMLAGLGLFALGRRLRQRR